MKRILSLLIISIFILNCFAGDNFLYFMDSTRSNENIDYPLFIKFGEHTLFLGNQDLNNRFRTNMPSKEFDGDLYIAAERHGRTFDYLPDNIEVLYTNGAYVLFSSEQDVIDNIEYDEDVLIKKVEFPEVIFEKYTSSRQSVHFSKEVDNVVNNVSKENLKKYVKQMVDYKTRYSFHKNYINIANDMKNIFEDMGYSSEVESFRSWKGSGYNVKAFKPGKTDNKILVVGHLDSTSPDPRNLAPGGDDNASGSAGVIEVARVLKDISLDRSVEFILFGGEENGLLGSEDYAKKYVSDSNIDYVINMDMVGFYKNNPDVIFMEAYSFCKDFMQVIAECGKRYSNFESEFSFKPFGSDHLPFLKRNVKAVLTIEKDWDKNSNYHQITDTMDDMSFEYLERVVRMNVAAVMILD